MTLALLRVPALFHCGETLLLPSAHAVFLSHVRQSSFFCDKAKLSLERGPTGAQTAPYASTTLLFTSHFAVGNTTRNGDGANDRGQVTLSGMVMLLRPRVIVTPLSDEKDTPTKVTFSAREITTSTGILLLRSRREGIYLSM